MKKKILNSVLVSFLLANIYVYVQQTSALDFLFSKKEYAVIEQSNKKVENLPVYNVVNYFTNQPLSARFLTSHNEMIQKQYSDEEFPLKLNSKPGVCIIDSFTNADEFGFKSSHGEFVSKMINKRYEGDIMQFNVLDVSYRDYYDFSECDVVNYSMAIHEKDRSETTFKNIEKFMQNYDGIMVVASGNEDHTVTKSEWSAYFNQYGNNQDWANRVIIVAQGVVRYNDNKELVKETFTSYGEEIDLIVFNTNEHIETYAMNGSSYATPVVTSVVANYLSLGVPKEDIKDLLIKSGNDFTDQYGFTYTDFQMNQANDNLIHYLYVNKLAFELK